MKQVLGCAAILAVVMGMNVSAEAKGCIKGALIGGVAGHFAGHHGALGAAAGCVVGHHEANKPPRRTQNTQQQRPQ